jgi:hypothetical protein
MPALTSFLIQTEKKAAALLKERFTGSIEIGRAIGVKSGVVVCWNNVREVEWRISVEQVLPQAK